VNKNILAPLFLAASLLLGACNITIDTSTKSSGDANSTAAAQTVQAALSAVPLSTPTDSVSVAPLSTDVMVPATTTTEAVSGCSDAAIHTDWTLDGKAYDVKLVNTPIAPNKKFIMAWTLQNTGDCTWDDSYVMNFVSGTQMTQEVNFTILQPGKTLPHLQNTTVSIEMTAPSAAGEYHADWRVLSPTGKALINFGVIIKVGNASTSSSLGKPGNLHYSYECTYGSMKVTLTWTDNANGEDGYRIYRDGAQVAVLPAGSTTYIETAPEINNYAYTIAPFNSNGEDPASVTVSPSACQ